VNMVRSLNDGGLNKKFTSSCIEPSYVAPNLCAGNQKLRPSLALSCKVRQNKMAEATQFERSKSHREIGERMKLIKVAKHNELSRYSVLYCLSF